MEKNQIVILEDRGLILVEGIDNKEFLQNIIKLWIKWWLLYKNLNEKSKKKNRSKFF